MRLNNWDGWLEVSEISHLDEHTCVWREKAFADSATAEVERLYAPAVESSLGINLCRHWCPTSDARISSNEVTFFLNPLSERVLICFKNFKDLTLIHLFEVRHCYLVSHSEGDRQYAISSYY